MKILNLTPHTITLCGNVIASSGCARCTVSTEQVDTLGGIPINRSVMGDVAGLPEPAKDTICIVSKIVLEALKGSRPDCFIVDKTVRDENGRIVGCEALAVL